MNRRKCAIKHTVSFGLEYDGPHAKVGQQTIRGTVEELPQRVDSGRQTKSGRTGNRGGATAGTAAYVAAGSAMNRARTERRMTLAVGIVKCCWNTGVLHNVVVSTRCLPSTSYRFLQDYVFSVSVKTC